MKTQTESVILENKSGQRLRIYKVEGTNIDGINTFCIGLEHDNEHFEFTVRDAEEITKAINIIVDSFA